MSVDPRSRILSIDELQRKLEEKDILITSLEQAKHRLEDRVKELESSTVSMTAPAEAEELLRRMMTKMHNVLQAEMCVMMLYNEEADELYAAKPAVGLTDDDLANLKIKADQGISGEVFREHKPLIFNDPCSDPKAIQENVDLFGIKNGICAPLTLEKRDHNTNAVTERRVIGVLHAFNKRMGNEFDRIDVNLITQYARQAAAVMAAAQVFREVVQEKEELETVIENVGSGIMMLDVSGRIAQINASARAVLGIEQDAKLTGGYKTIIKSESVRNVLSKAINDDGDLQEEVTLPSSDPDKDKTDRIYQVQTAEVKDEDGSKMGVAAIFNDITEIRSIERMKTAFVSTVSHELKTPLTSIKGFISTLLHDTEGFDEDTTREFYTIIDQMCDRLTRLINDLLNVSRIEAGRALELYPSPVKPVDIANHVVTVQKLYTSEHDLVVDFAADVPVIAADKDKLEQILTNLTNNAVKYSPNGGTVTITGRMHDGRVRITVADQGIGIPKEHLTRVFERFHRVDNRDTRKAGGTGIGLYIVKHLVEAHGGTVWAESEVGKGSQFIFELPKYPPQFEGEWGIGFGFERQE